MSLPANNSFSFIDLFAGIGGFHIALEKLGGKCVGFSEIDKDAIKTYQHNFPETPSLGDITKISENDLPDFDVLVGGFPCQPFSIGGKGLGMEESRGTLFFDIARIIKAKRPKIILLENVKNLASKSHKHEWDVIIKTIQDLGYIISSIPFIISPNHISLEVGGRSQERESTSLCI